VLDAPGNRLIFIDACHSGGVDNDRMIRSLMNTNAFVFTYSIVQRLRGRRTSLGMDQLSAEVSVDVPRITNDQQHPSAYSLGFHDFIISERRNCESWKNKFSISLGTVYCILP
jgi:hypothetical protein